MRPAGSPANAKEPGGFRVTPQACLRHDAPEGTKKRMPEVEAFDRWHDPEQHPIRWEHLIGLLAPEN